MNARIVLEFPSPEDAERVLNTISPDNSPLPTGLTIECRVKETKLCINIHCDRSLESFGATLEDIMSAIDLSMRTSDSVDSV